MSLTYRLKLSCLLLGALVLPPTASAEITYRLDSSVLNSPHADQIRASMDHAVNAYNMFSDYSVTIPVFYNASVPTANANYNGRIVFGGSRGNQTAIHEMGHIFGVGTYRNWSSNLRPKNSWAGGKANQRYRALEGSSSSLKTDASHFWNHGFNRSYEDVYKHVEIVGALREDMGLPNRSIVRNVVNNGSYEFKNVRSGKMVDVSGNQNQNLDPIVSWPSNNGTKQRWTLVPQTNGFFRLQNMRNQKCMDVAGSPKTNNGDPLVQWNCHGGSNQQWKPIKVGANRFMFQNRRSGKCMDLECGDTRNLAAYIQYSCSNSNTNQLFILTRPFS